MMNRRILLMCAALASLPSQAFAVKTTGSPPVSAPAANTIEDTDDGWTWSGMVATKDPNFSGGTARAGGPGSYGVYLFHGTGVEVFGTSGHQLSVNDKVYEYGKVKVSIDGHQVDTVNTASTTDSYNHKIFEVTDLKNKDHVLEVRPVGGWCTVDYIRPTIQTPKATAGEVNAGETFTDDFEDGTASAWTPINGEWGVKNGSYGAAWASGAKTLLRGSNYHDVMVEADVAGNPTGNAGILFRVANAFPGMEGYYGYLVTMDLANQQVMIGKSNNAWVQLTVKPYPIASNQRYRLKVIARGTHIDAFVNGQFIVGYDDSSYTAGAVGLRTFNTACGFDNIVVTSLDGQ